MQARYIPLITPNIVIIELHDFRDHLNLRQLFFVREELEGNFWRQREREGVDKSCVVVNNSLVEIPLLFTVYS